MTVETVVVDHPLVLDSLAVIRDVETPNALFRQNLERIGTLLIAEATQTLPTVSGTVETPLTTAAAERIAVQPVIVPILRAGLGFLRPAQELLPDADIGFIGIARNEETHQPEPYVNKLPDNIASRPVIVVDPMLATGGSLIHTLRLLIERGASQPLTVIVALAAPEGIAALEASGIDVTLFTAVVDERLNDSAYIVPGLGDAGDRQFGAPA
ncbi:MAG: uracil phosphoribosyltransferase [Ilumatobacter sp.]|jgi:uracil phosphoribosyltransferase|uniref:uracil phosphoribosyltransferase n=1 Tax=uncultured Ilumatobacter sp. TaxID=879968 RepID=UPI003590877D|tara:strand:+ start:28118 stop:28753 length:636 start_codon:yes stop_codon:yes gene_type:complete